ncbi:immunity 49 family protein [Streptomyces sp. NPDC087212]|uniref:immunity 49 family protein n=1 Tax=Streptomyces sp. NPDC087212 TaxID=3365766 RepID=UPI0037FF8A61
MIAIVPRHGVPDPGTESWAEELGEDVAEDAQRIERLPGSVDSMFTTALLHFQARCSVDPVAAKVETWEAAVCAMQFGSAMFAVTGTTEGTVECRINHEVRHVPAIGPRPYADAGNWLTAFWLAIVCRDQDRMTRLCEVPLDRLRSPGGEYDEYVYHWVDTLQTYWLQRPGLVEKLTATFETSDPAVARIAPRDLLDGQLYPPINLFYHFVRKDEDGFGPALEEALKLHRAYWTLNEDRADRTAGYLALGPLAIACLAHDGGIPIGVESDYLPKHLLQHSWLGEFPT